MRDVEANLEDEPSRKNGWLCPPHPLQCTAWIVLVVFAVLYFTSLVPALHTSWQPALYIVPGVALLVHLICHIVAISIDPSDPAVLRKKYPKRKFDRTKQQHVIEDCHCYICQVDVGSASKHCSICNKCISDFDHHCKWLNNCIGGRNYRWFLATLVTACIAMLLVTVIALSLFITYYTDQDNRMIVQPYRDLNHRSGNLTYEDAEYKIFYTVVPHELWLSILVVYFVLGSLAVGLIVHLFGFHIYLMMKKMSTYDYIMDQRDKEKAKKANDDAASIASSKRSKRNQIKPSSQGKGCKPKDKKEGNLNQSSHTPAEMQKVMMEAEREHRSAGETPPPSASPIHNENNNNNNNSKLPPPLDYAEPTEVKRLRKKKRKTSGHGDDQKSAISTIDNPRMYQNKGYTISRVDIPPIAQLPRVMPPPTVTPRGTGVAGEYHSDTADSLLEVPTDKSLTVSTLGSIGSEKKKVKKRVKKKRKESQSEVTTHSEDDDLNSTTLFTLNKSAKLKPDGSLEYSDFNSLPLTPQNLRKAQKLQEATDDNSSDNEEKKLNTRSRPSKKSIPAIPPLDFSGLRGSHESVSFQPYTATFRSTDTVNTDRLLPTLKEEKRQSKLNTVHDTEV